MQRICCQAYNLANDGCFSDGETVFTIAIKANDTELVDLLVSRGEDVNKGYDSCVFYQGSSHNYQLDIDRFHHTPLSWSIKKGHMEMARTMIKNERFLYHHSTYIAMFAAIESGCTELVRLMLENYEKCKYKQGSLDMTYKYSKYEYHINFLTMAVIKGNAEIARLLVDAGADANYSACRVDTADKNSPLQLAIMQQKTQHAISILSSDNFKFTMLNFQTLLLTLNTEQDGRFSIVEKILECRTKSAFVDTNLDSFTLNHKTALEMAIEQNDAAVAKLLVDNGANPNLKKMQDSDTPLVLAIRKIVGNNTAVVEAILRSDKFVFTAETFDAVRVSIQIGQRDLAHKILAKNKKPIESATVSDVAEGQIPSTADAKISTTQEYLVEIPPDITSLLSTENAGAVTTTTSFAPMQMTNMQTTSLMAVFASRRSQGSGSGDDKVSERIRITKAQEPPVIFQNPTELFWNAVVESKVQPTAQYLECLLQAGADPHWLQSERTPLAVAISQPDKVWIANIIVDNPKFSAPDSDATRYALYEAFNPATQQLDIAEKILEKTPKNFTVSYASTSYHHEPINLKLEPFMFNGCFAGGDNFLMVALKKRRPALVKILVNRLEDPNRLFSTEISDNGSREYLFGLSHSFLKSGSTSYSNQLDIGGVHHTPLSWAIKKQQFDLVAMLLSGNFVWNRYTYHALFAAIEVDDFFTFEAIIKQREKNAYSLDARYNYSKEYSAASLLEMAIDKENYKVIEFLCENGVSPLAKHLERTFEKENENLEIIKFFIKQGVKIDTVILEKAIKKGNSEIITFLVDNGANANAINSIDNDTPLSRAIVEGKTEAVLAILASDAFRFTDNTLLALLWAIRTENVDRVKIVTELLQRRVNNSPSLDLCTLGDKTALGIAIEQENAALITLLVDHGADANLALGNLPPALILAVRKNQGKPFASDPVGVVAAILRSDKFTHIPSLITINAVWEAIKTKQADVAEAILAKFPQDISDPNFVAISEDITTAIADLKSASAAGNQSGQSIFANLSSISFSSFRPGWSSTAITASTSTSASSASSTASSSLPKLDKS